MYIILVAHFDFGISAPFRKFKSIWLSGEKNIYHNIFQMCLFKFLPVHFDALFFNLMVIWRDNYLVAFDSFATIFIRSLSSRKRCRGDTNFIDPTRNF